MWDTFPLNSSLFQFTNLIHTYAIHIALKSLYTGKPIVMEEYLVLLWHKTGFMEFSVISDKYPMYSEIVSVSGISDNDIINYEIHY